MFAAICICWWWENRWLLLVFEALWRWNGKVGAIRQPFCQWIVIRKCQGRCLLALMPVPMALKALRRLEYCLDSGGGIWFLPCGIAGAPSWAGGERQVETTPVTENSIFIGSLMNKSTSCIGSMGTWVLWWTTPSSLPPPSPPASPTPYFRSHIQQVERKRVREKEREIERRRRRRKEGRGSSRGSAWILRSCIEWHRPCIIYCFSGAAATLGYLFFIISFFFAFCSFLLLSFFFLSPFFFCLSLSLSLSFVCVCVCVCVCWMRFLVTSRQLRR